MCTCLGMYLYLGEGHYMYNVRIIPTVYKKLGQQPHYSYEISFQESLHRVRE